ncbi:hypothetical protein N7476_003267 [Penicillium atrosanguineum]|uniref:DUF7702 domain-containing protein n=1 Tax=Penicillium atrosanguineum TaxID=1132637 RepID=A0A9W9Q851_9EURO|nr:hypothetical protein N7476_003267 [Penicillium atrosanguineum]
MLDSHSKLGIALVIFYIPVILLAVYLTCYRRLRPRMVWIIVIFFAFIRTAAGVLVIVTEQKPSLEVAIASTILLNTGVFPLIAATLGLIRIIMVLEKDKTPRLGQCLLLSRLLFFVGMGLTVAGGALEGSDNNSDALTGVKLVKAGYFIVLVFLICLLVVQGYFWQQSSRLSRTARTALKAMALATPFMVVRITFLFLLVFDSSDLR